MLFFFFKQKTAYEMRISDWSSDVCSSDLIARLYGPWRHGLRRMAARTFQRNGAGGPGGACPWPSGGEGCAGAGGRRIYAGRPSLLQACELQLPASMAGPRRLAGGGTYDSRAVPRLRTGRDPAGGRGLWAEDDHRRRQDRKRK